MYEEVIMSEQPDISQQINQLKKLHGFNEELKHQNEILARENTV
jgi:hypothetical protein